VHIAALQPAALRRPPVAALVAAALALGVALLAPRAFSDPVSVDPFDVRLAAACLVLLGASLVWQPLAPARPVLLAVAGIVVPFSLWAATPRAMFLLYGDRFSYNQRIFGADVTYMVATLVICAAAIILLPVRSRPALRLRSLSPLALAVGVGGTAVLVLVAFAIPAQLLGREGIEPAALGRDMPWLAPAYVLQAAAQEVQFRGLLLGALERDLPPWAANLGQASLFGVAHIAVQYEGPAGPFVPVTVALGLLLGYATQRTRSLWPAILIHAVLEVGVAVVVLDGLYGL
jgi:membrane protease YdiL (CAAX protease family)